MFEFGTTPTAPTTDNVSVQDNQNQGTPANVENVEPQKFEAKQNFDYDNLVNNIDSFVNAEGEVVLPKQAAMELANSHKKVKNLNADYTRKTQLIASERQEISRERQQYLDRIKELEGLVQSNPTQQPSQQAPKVNLADKILGKKTQEQAPAFDISQLKQEVQKDFEARLSPVEAELKQAKAALQMQKIFEGMTPYTEIHSKEWQDFNAIKQAAETGRIDAPQIKALMEANVFGRMMYAMRNYGFTSEQAYGYALGDVIASKSIENFKTKRQQATSQRTDVSSTNGGTSTAPVQLTRRRF
jgi:hypothetical protein